MCRQKQDCNALRYYETNVNVAMSFLELRHLAQQGNTPIQDTKQIAVCHETGNSHYHGMARHRLEPKKNTSRPLSSNKGMFNWQRIRALEV